jgi:hypothetical protein
LGLGQRLASKRSTEIAPCHLATTANTKLWLKTNEHEEAVRSLEYAALWTTNVCSDPYFWKWVLISIHNAAQGFMVLALWQGNGLLTLPDNVAKKWYKAYQDGTSFPADKLDKFMNLYCKVKDNQNFHTVGVGPFVASSEHDESFELLNSFRNEFIHFTPKGWTVGITGLPHVCLHILDLIEFFGWKIPAILWYKQIHQVRAKRALRKMRRSLHNIASIYGRMANPCG